MENGNNANGVTQWHDFPLDDDVANGLANELTAESFARLAEAADRLYETTRHAEGIRAPSPSSESGTTTDSTDMNIRSNDVSAVSPSLSEISREFEEALNSLDTRSVSASPAANGVNSSNACSVLAPPAANGMHQPLLFSQEPSSSVPVVDLQSDHDVQANFPATVGTFISGRASLEPEDVFALPDESAFALEILNFKVPRLLQQLGAVSIARLALYPPDNSHQLRIQANFQISSSPGHLLEVTGMFRIGLPTERNGGDSPDFSSYQELIPRRIAVGAFLAKHGMTVPSFLAYDTTEDNALGLPFEFQEIDHVNEQPLEGLYPTCLSLDARIEIAEQLARFNFEGLSGISFPEMGLLEPALGQLARRPAGEPQPVDLPDEYNALDGSRNIVLVPDVLPTEGQYRKGQSWELVKHRMSLSEIIDQSLYNQERKCAALQPPPSINDEYSARLGSVPMDPRALCVSDFCFAFRAMQDLDFFRWYDQNTNAFFTGGTSPSDFRVRREDGHWRLSTFIGWDEASSMPGLMLFQPPTWLWSSLCIPEEKQERFKWNGNDDFIDPGFFNGDGGHMSEDDMKVKAAYEDACVLHIRNASRLRYYGGDNYDDDTYGKGRLVRMLLAFALSGDDAFGPEWCIRHRTFVRCWQKFFENGNYGNQTLPSLRYWGRFTPIQE